MNWSLSSDPCHQDRRHPNEGYIHCQNFVLHRNLLTLVCRIFFDFFIDSTISNRRIIQAYLLLPNKIINIYILQYLIRNFRKIMKYSFVKNSQKCIPLFRTL